MKVRYIGPFDAVELAGQVVTNGNIIDVDKTVGASLCEQESNWQAVADAPKSKKDEEVTS